MMIDLYTDYSLLNSLLKIKDLVKMAEQKKWKYLGMADTEAGGLLDFYLICKENGIKPIIGLRMSVTNNLEEINDSNVIFYPQSMKGYLNLIKLSTKASLEGFKNEQANVLVDWIQEFSEDLLCVLPIGESPNELQTENGSGVVKKLRMYFQDKLFYGLYNRNTSKDDIWLNKAKEKKTPYLFLSGAKYFKTEDLKAYKTLRCISERTSFRNLWETVWLDESIENAERQHGQYEHQVLMDKFVSLINLDIPTPGLKVPKFQIPEQYESSYDYLIALCREGYKAKKENFETNEKQKIVSERMKFELDVIKRCELADYFLLVYDICKYCDDNDIPRGISRGSAAGSLITFLLDISRVNPLDFNLLFERFLNEDRTRPVVFNGEKFLTDAPDIDLDVGQLQRQQIIDFLRTKYGFVAKIATYTTLGTKAVLKDVIKVFGGSEAQAAYVAKFVEARYGKNNTIAATYKEDPEFKEWADQNKQIFDVALKLEGVKKNCSIHPAGLIISSESIENRAPLFLANSTGDEFKRDTCIQYSLDIAAKAGLLKVDLLGLRTQNVLQEAIKLINAK